MDFLTQSSLHVFDHAIIIGLAEQIGEEKPRNIYALIGIRIAVIRGNAFGIHPQDFTRHVREKARLFIRNICATNLREELLGKNISNNHGLMSLDGPRVNILAEPFNRLIFLYNSRRLMNRLLNDIIKQAIVSARANNQLVNILIIFHS